VPHRHTFDSPTRTVTRRGSGDPGASVPLRPCGGGSPGPPAGGRATGGEFAVGLLPEIGFVHEVAPSKLPLAYDLQEPFRWLVDLSVIEVIRDGKLDRKRDFIVTENYHVRLRPAAAKVLIDRFSANLNRKVKVEGKSMSFETAISETARRLARHLTGPRARLDLAYPFEVGESGHVTPEFKDRVVSLTYAEGRKLGISKAGLWDMKRRAAVGKPLRLYGKVARRIPPPSALSTESSTRLSTGPALTSAR
jgi:CRISPR-associated protein Cas1